MKTIGSVCSGIEAASVAWSKFQVKFEWFSEIADFPSKLLSTKYPSVPNVGDMSDIPKLLLENEITAPDVICGGTPCQAFSLAGWKNGLNDDRGNLTLKFVDIIEANDKIRLSLGKQRCVIFWENVEGVLSDKTNAFGCLVSSLAGLNDVLQVKNNKWPNSGLIQGPKRNVAWRVLDSKYFGLPQQRRRLYLIAGGVEFKPENILFELHENKFPEYPSTNLQFEKDGCDFEVFREYTDCLYSAYGTKWNGNAAAYNGSLFVVQNGRIRRLSPLETERLMGFPDNYTYIEGASKTKRYQATGNSWAVPVVQWLGERLFKEIAYDFNINKYNKLYDLYSCNIDHDDGVFYNFGKKLVVLSDGQILNCTSIPEDYKFTNIQDIISSDAPEDIYISPAGCYGIIRRKTERNLKINKRLERVLLNISSQIPMSEIEKKSRVQKRGRFSVNKDNIKEKIDYIHFEKQISLF